MFNLPKENEIRKTKSPGIARKSWPYHLHPKPSLRFPVMERKRFFRGETVPCMLC